MKTETPFDRLPPHDIEAEEALIAACLVEDGWQYLPEIVAMVRPRHFFREVNAFAFEAILEVWESGQGPNQLTVARAMAQADHLEEFGGQTRLAEYIRQLPTAIGADYYAGLVKRAAEYRELIHVANGITQMAYEAPADIGAVVTRARELIDRVGSEAYRSRIQSGRDVLDDGLERRLEEFITDPRKVWGIPTGWSDLDLLIDGWQNGSAYLVAAETSVGKSRFVQGCQRNIARRDLRPLFVSTEMTNKAVGWREIFARAALDERVIKRRGSVSEDEQKRLWQAASDYATARTAWLNPWEGGLAEVRAAAMSTTGLDIAILDHIDHLIEHRSASRANDVADGMRQVKRMAIQIDRPLIVVSHMNRAEDSGLLSRLLDGGAKERDADVVMFLRPMMVREGEWQIVPNEMAQLARSSGQRVRVALDVFKNREGSCGRVVFEDAPGGTFAQVAGEDR